MVFLNQIILIETDLQLNLLFTVKSEEVGMFPHMILMGSCAVKV